MAQVAVFVVHKFLYGIIPLFEISTCAYFPLLVSLWHLNYLLFYAVMFMRLIILEPDFHSRWIKIVGLLLILLRFSVWPFELAYVPLQNRLMKQPVIQGGTCWAEWGNGVSILSFISDVLANLFLSGMFVRRLYLHIRTSKKVMSRQNRVIEHIARKSLWCLILTFIVNLTMNLLKVTTFLGNRSDAFTVYFSLIESTLLVEALRIDYTRLENQAFCEHCGVAIRPPTDDKRGPPPNSNNNDEYLNVSLKIPDSLATPFDGHHSSTRNSIIVQEIDHRRPSSMQPLSHPLTSSNDYCPMSAVVSVDPDLLPDSSSPSYDFRSSSSNMRNTTSAPSMVHDFGNHRPFKRTAMDRESMVDPTNTFGSTRLSYRPEWSNNEFRMF
ncbi:hypothetical protein BDA99DRAFT_43582 [Phascolomyces articulosus]|uniref:Uncharacterized protein n=1 Tax=Phascolomyces articulosus TaxID=60185 RepID=A0AAD5K1Z6_9FUNG|nr:hypothetical protein BDA99DRAFT_43582 [Phascolomyces articulosus]